MIYYESEKVLLPLMIHQNYLNVLNHKYNDPEDTNKKYEQAQEISELLSNGDVIENYIYGEQIWDLNDVHGYYSCIAPSYLLSYENINDKINISFPTDLNKASIAKINKKNIINADKNFKNKNIQDYIYINLIIRNLLEENRINECASILNKYNIKLANIEILLKVDKIKSSKMNLSSKQKKALNTYFD